MSTIIKFHIGQFFDSKPNWFDWLSLIVSLLGIAGGYAIATVIYSREKKDRNRDEKVIQNAEITLFKNSLTQLLTAVKAQIAFLNTYIVKQNFVVKVVSGVQIQFLKYINIRHLYKDAGIDDKKKFEQINGLLSVLYSISGFTNEIRNELRRFSKKYNYHEEQFYTYRKLIYTVFYKICYRRAASIEFADGKRTLNFSVGDEFIIEYNELVQATLIDPDIIFENQLVSRSILVEKFIIPLIVIAGKYIPGDPDAIEILDLANSVHAAYQNMTITMETSREEINSQIDILKAVERNIQSYLENS